jgi:hypothetical protein
LAEVERVLEKAGAINLMKNRHVQPAPGTPWFKAKRLTGWRWGDQIEIKTSGLDATRTLAWALTLLPIDRRQISCRMKTIRVYRGCLWIPALPFDEPLMSESTPECQVESESSPPTESFSEPTD